MAYPNPHIKVLNYFCELPQILNTSFEDFLSSILNEDFLSVTPPYNYTFAEHYFLILETIFITIASHISISHFHL